MKVERKIPVNQNIINNITIAIIAVLFSLQMVFSTYLRANVVVDGILDAIMQGVLLIAEAFVFVRGVLKLKALNKSDTSEKYAELIKLAFPLLLVLIITIVNSVRGGGREEDSILILCVMAALCVDFDYRSILKTAYRCGVVIVLIAFILSMLGIIENNRGNSFGFVYRTDYACHLLFLFLIFCFYYGGNLSAKGELGILLMTIINMVFIGGKTSYVCMSIVVFVTYLRHYRRLGKVPYQNNDNEGKIIKIVFRIIYIPVIIVDKISKKIKTATVNNIKTIIRTFYKFSFIIFAAVMIGLTMLYAYMPVEIFEYIPKSGTIKSRLSMGIVGFEQFSIKLFGNTIPQRGAGGREGYIPFYYFLDSSYIRMILQFGLIVFVILVGLMTFIQLRLYKEKMFYEMFLLAVVALDCAMEHHIIDFSYNTFALLMWASFAGNNTENVKSIFWVPYTRLNNGENSSKSEHQMSPKLLRFAYRGIICLVCVIVCCSLFASYKITTFRGREPISAATVILTGNSIDGVKSERLLDEKIKSVRSFMNMKENAVCILSGTEAETEYMREILTDYKIDDGRLYEIAAKDMENTIKESDLLIKKNNLPKRKAVSSFKMQQKRIWELAHRNGIPVNMLNANMPADMYIPCYFAEQVKLIKVLLENNNRK